MHCVRAVHALCIVTVVVDNLVNIAWVRPILPDASADIKIWDKHGPQHTKACFMEFEVGIHDGAYEGRLHSQVPSIGQKTLVVPQKTSNDIPLIPSSDIHGCGARVEHLFAHLGLGGVCMTFGWGPMRSFAFVPCACVLPQRWLDFRVVMGKLNYYLALCALCAETPPWPLPPAFRTSFVKPHNCLSAQSFCTAPVPQVAPLMIILFLLLILHAVTHVLVAAMPYLRNTNKPLDPDGQEALETPRSQILAFFVLAHIVTLSVCAVTCGINGNVAEVIVAAVLLAVNAALLLSFYLHPSPRRIRGLVAAIVFVAWPTFLLVEEPSVGRFFGALIGHAVAMLLAQVMCCSPATLVVLTLGSLAFPIVTSLIAHVEFSSTVVEVGALLVLPLVVLNAVACRYVYLLHNELSSAHSQICELRQQLSTSHSLATALESQIGLVGTLVKRTQSPLNSVFHLIGMMKDGTAALLHYGVCDSLLALCYQVPSFPVSH